MLSLTRGYVLASLLVPYLQGEIDGRGWNAADLAREADVDKSSISKLFQNPERIPTLVTLRKLGHALDVPLIRLVKMCGFDPGQEDEVPDAEQVAILFETMPELREVVKSWAHLSIDYRRALVVYVDGLRRQQQSQA